MIERRHNSNESFAAIFADFGRRFGALLDDRFDELADQVASQQSASSDNGKPLLVGREEAARTLGISISKLDLETKAGRIPSRPIGRRVMYSFDTLREMCAEHDQDAATSSRKGTEK